MNYLKNNAVFRTGTKFVDFDEPERKRHLMRLSLTAHTRWADGDAIVQQGIPVTWGLVSDAEESARAAEGARAERASARKLSLLWKF